jgi:NAD(P)-dependent dehydrogenase (short-subunit alcohol dehydrogenase family)
VSRNNRIALVTGASSGFGRLISLELAEAGFHVIATMRDLSKTESLVKSAFERGVENAIEVVRLDVTQDDVSDIVGHLINQHGTIDVLVNNAGFAAGGFTEDISMDEWVKQFDTNVFGTIRLTKAVLPSMREAGFGTIINISSISGRMAFPGLGPYSASKFAVEGFSEALRLEMKPFGVHVVLVEPGSYKTNIWSKGTDSLTVNPDSPYGYKTKRLLKMVNKIAEKAGNPQEVAIFVRDIALSKHPRFRYPIGKGVKSSIRLKHMVPWRLIERMIVNQVHK